MAGGRALPLIKEDLERQVGRHQSSRLQALLQGYDN